MLIVIPSLIILALGTLVVLVIKAAFPTTVRNEHSLLKKTILYKSVAEKGTLEERDRNRGPIRRQDRELRPSDYIPQDNTQNLP